MIRTVLIDIDDTLLDFDLCAAWSMNAAAKSLGLCLPPDAPTVFHRVNTALWKSLEKKEISTDELYGVRWNTIAKEWGILLDGHAFEAQFLHFLSQSVVPVEGAVNLLRYLKSKYRVFAASNGPYAQQISRMTLAGMAQYLDGYCISEQIGHQKPSREFFKACLQKTASASPAELIMIGDSLSADILGAADFGMQTCWYNKKRLPAEGVGGYIAERLEDIFSFL